MSYDMKVSSPSDPLCVWQRRPIEADEPSSSIYEYVENKVLTVRSILSTPVSVKQMKHSLSATLNTAVETARSTSEIAYEILSTSVEMLSKYVGDLPRLANGVRFISIIAMPTTLITLVNNCYLSIYGSGKERAHAFLNAMEDFGSAITSVSIFAMGIQGLGAAGEATFRWFGSVSLVAAVFSSASIYINGRRCSKMQRLGNKLDKVVDLTAKNGEASLADYRAFLSIFGKKIDKHSEALRDYFYFDQQQLGSRLIEIEQQAQHMLLSSELNVQRQGQQLLYKTMETLRGRIKHNVISSGLAATAAAVGVLGTIVLAACPVAPVGAGISGLGAVIGAVIFVHQRVVDYQFMQQLGVERKWHEWITC